MTQDDERMDAAIRELATEYRRPPETPRDLMWARIQAERSDRARRLPAPRGIRWTVWVAGLAATLAIGVALGRITAVRGAPEIVAAPESAAAGEAVDGVPAAYRVATAEHLSRVETFLTVFTGEVEAGRAEGADLETPVRQLLRRTRLLRESPAAADDVVLRALLDDVEFVLLQIASYARAGDEDERGFVEQGITQRSVLLRLRSVMPSPPARTAAEGAL
jgi:hypothetical protein